MPTIGLQRWLQPGDTLLVSAGVGEPRTLIEELCSAADRLSGGLRVIQVMTGSAERLAEKSGSALRLLTPAPGPKSRKAIVEDRAELLALSMSGLSASILDGRLRIDGVLVLGKPVEPGQATPGLIADIMVPAWERARFRALELNDRLPRLDSSLLNIKEAQYVVESSFEPGELLDDPVSDLSRIIADHIVELIPDGSTVELGVGRALAGVTDALSRQRLNLAMHSGILGNAAMRLIKTGCVSRTVRGNAMAVGATAMGTREFYAWADANPLVALVDSRVAHCVELLAQTPSFCAINSAIQVDLSGNANSMVYRGKKIGGIGGVADFAHAGTRGQASIIAMLSTTPSGNSTIVPKAEAVSVPGMHVTHVVTECGVADIRNLNGADRARAIIQVAASQHRQQLAEAL